MASNVAVEMGWGRLIFGHTYDSSSLLAEAITDERPGDRDIALYLRDPHVVLALAPQELFLDPSHTYRLWSRRYRPSKVKSSEFMVRRLARGHGGEAPACVDEELDQRWPGPRPVRQRLGSVFSQLEELPNTGPRRLAYLPPDGMSTPELADVLATALDTIDVDVVQTGDGCVDVVPKNVTCGFTVDRVLEWLEAEPEWVVVASDTLRHADLFRPGRCGIVVADADEGLKSRAAAHAGVYLANEAGAMGVLEGLRHFGFVSATS
jgi:hypothetical protein